ncbi:MAG: nucleotidyltransferase domain-containing protein [Candidatus Hydrogenedentes bacterium]|nr:nucleotidyltransferase domain-containing protein [Candidatus Hydrogenedentota bacterium]MBI3118157.1 nucleotidyltransferase domain-containing protein [Candidatus Hydrogenedentota bacterium]
MALQIEVDAAKIAEFCQKHHIAKLSFFGSVLGEEFSDNSDVDVLVEYLPGHLPDFFVLFDQEDELSGILGRQADMRTPEEFSQRIRGQVISSAHLQYAA